MRISKVWLLGIICLVLFGSFPVFAGGGQQSSQGAAANERDLLNPLGQLPIVKEKITLTMGMVRSVMSPDLINNYKTIELEKDSNIKLDFIYYGATGTEAQQKLEIEIMAGGTELPDIINFGLDTTTIGFYGSQGMLIPLDNYINNSSYWMKDGIKEMPFDPWKYIRSADNHIYSLFNYAGEFVTEICARMYINTAWLNDANLAMPTSTVEFENMLRAFKNRPPNADGRRTYPFIDIRDNVRQARFIAPLVGPYVYIGASNRWFYKEPNGTISPVFTTDGWRQALTWIRGMVDEGLIDPLSFTQDAEQIKAIGSSTNQYAMGSSTYYPLNYIPLDDPRSETWALMGPLSGPNGGDPIPTYSQNLAGSAYYITKNCKYPEAAFRLGDLMMSEKYSVIGRWGEEGVDWIKPAPTEKSYFEGIPAYLIPIYIWDTPTTRLWTQQQGPAIKPYRIFNGSYVVGKLKHLELWNAEAASKSIPYYKVENSIGSIIYAQDEFEKIAEIRANVETYFLESYTRFLLRDMSLENDWNRYLTELRNMGLDTYVQVSRTAYERINR